MGVDNLVAVVVRYNHSLVVTCTHAFNGPAYLSFLFSLTSDGRGRSVGSASAWYVDGRGFDSHVRQHSFVEIGHEKFLRPFSTFH